VEKIGGGRQEGRSGGIEEKREGGQELTGGDEFWSGVRRAVDRTMETNRMKRRYE
jgi:hypothetical protein